MLLDGFKFKLLDREHVRTARPKKTNVTHNSRKLMTSHSNVGTRPPHSYLGYDHLTFYVGNAAQASHYYTSKFGFRCVGYRGLETGSRSVVEHVVRQGNVIFVLRSTLVPGDVEMGAFLGMHGIFRWRRRRH